MIPQTIVVQPEEAQPRRDPDIIPMPGTRRPEREPGAHQRPSGGANSPELGPREILNALRYHGVLFVTLGAVAALSLGVTAWTLIGPKYTSYASVKVEQLDPTIIPSQTGVSESGNFATVLKTQANLIKNRKVIGGALLDPKSGIAQLPMLRKEEDPAAFLEEKLLADITDTSNQIFKISLSGEDPEQITKILNAVVEFYMLEVSAWRRGKHERIVKLEKNKEYLDGELRKRLQHYQDHLLPAGVDEKATVRQRLRMNEYVNLLTQRNAFRGALGKSRADLKAAQSKLEQYDANPPPLPITDLSAEMDKDNDIKAKEFGVKRLQRDRKAIVDQSSHPNPAKLAEYDQKIAAEQADLEAMRRQFRSTFETRFRTATRLKLAADLEKAQDDAQRMEAQENAIAEQLGDYKEFKELDETAVQKKMAEQVREKLEIDNYHRELSNISDSIVRLKVDLDAPDRVAVVHWAEVPSKKDIRKQAAISGAAGLAGFALVGGLISLYEIRRKRIFGPKDAIFRQKLPLLACIPNCVAPATAVNRIEGIDPLGTAFFEAVDKVKAVVCRHLQRRRMQTLLITSAAPGEGKSGLAWHLALSLARSDRRTLFIDGNLRNPGLHNIFDIASHPGLAELLRGERSVQEVVQRSALDNLWCIPAGVCDDAARHALDKDAMRNLIDRSRRDFDYVVIDSCSLREAVDPLYLAQRADATILAVRCFESNAVDVERAVERLTQIGTPLLGAVLTDPSAIACEV